MRLVDPLQRADCAMVGTFSGTATEFPPAIRRRTDQHEDELLFVLQINAIGPDVDVTFGRKIELLPLRMLVLPNLL